MSSDPIDRSFEGQGVNELIVTTGRCGEKQKDHPAFQENVPEYVTQPPGLMDLAAKMTAARDDKNMAGQLKVLMVQTVQALNNNADHVVKFAKHRNDPSLLENAGYDLRPDGPVVKERIRLLDLVPGLTVKHIPGVSGGIYVSLKLAKSRAITELQITETPEVEDSWRPVGEGVYNTARVKIMGQQPAKRMFLRARYHERGGAGHWCAPVSIIIL
jgi:hypothetical protein